MISSNHVSHAVHKQIYRVSHRRRRYYRTHPTRRQYDVPRNDAVEGASEKVQRLARGANSTFTGDQRAEVLRSLRDNIGPKRHLNAPKRSAIGGHLQTSSSEGVTVSHRRVQPVFSHRIQPFQPTTNARQRKRLHGGADEHTSESEQASAASKGCHHHRRGGGRQSSS